MTGHGQPSVGPRAVRRVMICLYLLCTGWVLLDFTYTKHGHYGFEEIPGFHAAYGFVSCVFLVLAATRLRRAVKRDEDYYDD